MLNVRTISVGVMALALAAGVGCSSDPATADAGAGTDAQTPPSDASQPDASQPDASQPDASQPDASQPDAAKPDAGKTVVNNCNDFQDGALSATNREIDWTLAVAASPKRCTEIKVGQTITWKGDFGVHPLAASGGDTPSPIVNGAAGAANVTVTFTAPGVFGFKCDNHPTMLGAIKVIP